MNTSDYFQVINPSMARDRFLVQDESWDERFRPDFNQFIIAPIEFARPVIKLPIPAARTANHALFLITDGQAEVTIGHQAYLLKANELVEIPAIQIFSLMAIREDTTGVGLLEPRSSDHGLTGRMIDCYQSWPGRA